MDRLDPIMQPLLGLQLALEVVNSLSGNRRPAAITQPPPQPTSPQLQGPPPLDVTQAARPAYRPPVQRQTVVVGSGRGTAAPPTQSQSFLDTVGGAIGGSFGGVPGRVGEGLMTAMTAPQAAVIEDQGSDMYAYVTGQHDAITRVVDENLPFRRFLFEWAAKNPEKVKTAYEEGYWDRDHQTQFKGGRAVWELYARENLTGPSPQSIAVGLVTDPWNALPVVGRAGEATAALGRAARAGAATDAARAAAAAPSPSGIGTIGEDLVLRATDDLLSNDPARVRAVLENISPELAVQVEAGAFPIAQFPNGVQGLARASAMQTLRRQGGASRGIDRLGRTLEIGGRAIEAPARLLDELPGQVAGRFAGGVGRLADATPGVRQAKSRVGASVGRWLQESPAAKAMLATNNVMADRAILKDALKRQRQLEALLGPDLAAAITVNPTAGAPTSPFPGVRRTPGQRTLADAEVVPATTAEASPSTAADLGASPVEQDALPRRLPGRVVQTEDGYYVADRATGEPVSPVFESYWEARDYTRSGASRTQARLQPAAVAADVPPGGERPRFLTGQEAARAAADVPESAVLPEPTDVAPVDVPERQAAQPSPQRQPYESSVAAASERVQQKIDEFTAGADPATRGQLDEIFTQMEEDFAQLRRESGSIEGGGRADRVRQRANHADFWVYEFRAEQDARAVLRAAGLPEPPHVNREVGGLAKALDDVAWGDDAAAERARRSLDAILERAEESTVAPAIQSALDEAEEFRGGATIADDVAEEVAQPTLLEEPAPRPAAPTAEASARASLSLPPSANGYTDVAVSELRTDPARFQPRGELSTEQIDRIAREFDWGDFDPIKVWRDPADGNLYVLKGHHRLAAVQKRGDIESVPIHIVGGTEDEAISRGRTSNAERAETELEKAATVRREFEIALSRTGIDPTTLDESAESTFLAGLKLPNVSTTKRREFLNLARLPRAIQDDLAVHPNAGGKAVRESHARLGSRISASANPRGGMATVAPQEAEALYRVMQRQKRKKPDDPLPALTGGDVNRLVEHIDAMTGMSRTEQVGLFAGMVTDDGRAAQFVTALDNMAKKHKELLRRQTTHEKSLRLLEADVTALRGELAALGDDGWDADLAARISEKHDRYQSMLSEVQEARQALTEAQLESTRLVNSQQRNDDTSEYLLHGMLLPPPDDVVAAVRGGFDRARSVLDWTDEAVANHRAADAQAAQQSQRFAQEIAATPGVSTGPIVPEQVTLRLNARFGPNNPTYHGRTIGEVADEIETRIVADKADLMRLLSGPTSLLPTKDAARLAKLQRRYRGVNTLADVTKIDEAKALRAELRAAFNQEYGHKAATGLGGALDKLSTVYSAMNLLLPWTVPRYYLGNLMGDTWQIGLNDGLVAAGAANDPINILHMTRYAMKGGDPLHGAIGDLVKQAGLGGFHPRLVTENLAESIISSEATAVRRAGGRARFNWIGDAGSSSRNPVNVARNLVNGMEWAHRTGLWGHHFRMNVINARHDFATEMTDLAGKYGITGEEVHQVMDLYTVVDGAEIADTFARLAQRRGRSNAEAAGFGQEMGRKWANRVYQANETAVSQVDDSLFSYAQTNADATLRRVIPFHWWMSRAIPFYAEQMIRHPGFAHAYYRTYAATREQAEAEGWPDSLKRFLRVFEGPGGMLLMLNPLATLGVLDSFVESDGGYTEENVSAIGSLLSGVSDFGFGLLPWWGAALNHLGYLGESPFGLDPIGLHQTRNLVGGILQFAAGEGWLGPDGERLLAKPYEQALRDVRDKLSGFGLPLSYHIQSSDPNAVPAIQIRNMMLRRELEQRGMDVNQYMALGMHAQQDPTSPEAELLEEINDLVASDELDAGPLYRAAVKDYSEANVGVLAVNAVVPGPKRVRQEESLAIQSMSRALRLPITEGSDAVVGGGLGVIPVDVRGRDQSAVIEVDHADAEFARRWKAQFGEDYTEGDLNRMRLAASEANRLQNAPPETARLIGQNSAYHTLGTEKAQQRLEIRNAIWDGRRGVKIPGQDIDLSQAEVARLSEEERGILANAWLDAHDTDGQAATLNNLRDLYAETHPEYGAYQQWARDTREQWGGAAAFRVAAVRENENYAEFIRLETNKLRAEGLPPSEILDELDRSSLGLNAYMAYQGLRASRYDPMPREAGVPIPVASEGAPLGALGGGGEGGWQDWDDRVRAAILETDQAVAIANEFAGTNIMQMPPQIRDGLFAMPSFPAEGMPPDDAWIYEDYLDFYREQARIGGDQSIEAFIAMTKQEFAGDANIGTQFAPNTWPPVAIAS